MKNIVQEAQSGSVMISDGAWGTLLQKKGLKAGECPELWNITRPGDVLEIAKRYIDAGADMIETNSFGGNAFKLSYFSLQEQTASINKAAAAISRRAAGDKKHVLGSIGPTGKMLAMGDATYRELYEAFKTQAVALAEGGADALIIETMSDLEEAKCAIRACREHTSCEIICTMTFSKSAEKAYHTMMGVTPAQMTNELIEAGADIVGANCGNGIVDMIDIVEEIRSVHQNIPVLIHANAGNPVYKDGETIFPETPQVWSAHIKDLIAAGANIVGGCCGTTPEHIQKIAQIVRKRP